MCPRAKQATTSFTFIYHITRRSIMNNKTFISLIFCLVLTFSCGKEAPVSRELTQKSIQSEQESAALSEASDPTNVSGIGYYAEAGECDAKAGKGADYALRMTGDLEGCVYTFIDKAECI